MKKRIFSKQNFLKMFLLVTSMGLGFSSDVLGMQGGRQNGQEEQLEMNKAIVNYKAGRKCMVTVWDTDIFDIVGRIFVGVFANGFLQEYGCNDLGKCWLDPINLAGTELKNCLSEYSSIPTVEDFAKKSKAEMGGILEKAEVAPTTVFIPKIRVLEDEWKSKDVSFNRKGFKKICEERTTGWTVLCNKKKIDAYLVNLFNRLKHLLADCHNGVCWCRAGRELINFYFEDESKFLEHTNLTERKKEMLILIIASFFKRLFTSFDKVKEGFVRTWGQNINWKTGRDPISALFRNLKPKATDGNWMTECCYNTFADKYVGQIWEKLKTEKKSKALSIRSYWKPIILATTTLAVIVSSIPGENEGLNEPGKIFAGATIVEAGCLTSAWLASKLIPKKWSLRDLAAGVYVCGSILICVI